MNLSIKLRKLFYKKTEFNIKPEHKTRLAFTSQGEDYFCFDDTFNVPSKRALCALDFYDEFEMGCNKEYLRAMMGSLKRMVNDSKAIDKVDLSKIIAQTEERIEFIKSPDLFLKLSSALYFDKSENPYGYDYAYGREKIERWKKDEKVLDFFLQNHIGKLLPHLRKSGVSTQTYFQITTEANKKHLAFLSSLPFKRALKQESANN